MAFLFVGLLLLMWITATHTRISAVTSHWELVLKPGYWPLLLHGSPALKPGQGLPEGVLATMQGVSVVVVDALATPVNHHHLQPIHQNKPLLKTCRHLQA
jgi:hypothetical protein